MNNLDYGIIGNCRTAALISKKGSIDWMCFPDFDSPSVFARILDENQGGYCSIEVGEQYTITQHYKNHSNILITRFESEDDAFEIKDFMPRYVIAESGEYYMAPELYRYIKLLYGKPKLRIHYAPAIDYARGKTISLFKGDFIRSHLENNHQNSLYLYASLPYKALLSGEEISLTECAFILISYNQKLIQIDLERARLEYQRTKVYWMNWNNRTKRFLKYDNLIERSGLVLKLLSYHNSGAVLAAITTSLPEAVGEVRNWDYRFCWLRDASMSIEILLRIGHQSTARRYIHFVKSILKSKDDHFQIMYGIRGERELHEKTLMHLKGFKESRPVRVGNDAWHQQQNDTLGYVMNVILNYYYHFPGTLDEIEEMWTIVKLIVSNVLENWEKADKGIWEIRGEAQHFVQSKMMSWVCLDRAERIAKILQKDAFARIWRKKAQVIKNDILTHGWNDELQSFTQTYSNKELDASLLLMNEYGFIEAKNPRYIKTVETIHKKLMHNGLMYRYTNQDDFGTPSSAFTICTFWMVRALYRIGRKKEAEELFEQLIRYSNHLNLFSEDLHFETKEQLGNFPQAYSHLALIETAALFTEEKKLSKFIKP